MRGELHRAQAELESLTEQLQAKATVGVAQSELEGLQQQFQRLGAKFKVSHHLDCR